MTHEKHASCNAYGVRHNIQRSIRCFSGIYYVFLRRWVFKGLNSLEHSFVQILLMSCISLFVLQSCVRSTNLTETRAPNAGEGASDLQATFQPITDIPIPPGTTLDAQNSLILGSGDVWTGRLVLNLEQNHSEAFALYTTQMPQFGWRPIASVQSETSLLTFIRGNRATTVEIIEGRAMNGCLVRITMSTQGQAVN